MKVIVEDRYKMGRMMNVDSLKERNLNGYYLSICDYHRFFP